MNRFGDANNKYALVDPRGSRQHRLQYRREHLPLLERANSLYVASGCWPSRGWVLLPRIEFDKLDKYSTSLELEINNPDNGNNVGTIKNLTIAQAQCVTRGLAADDNALYLIEITDPRGIVCNKWFQFPLNSQYNIRAPAYPQTFFPDSLNSGATWTWDGMLEDIWNRVSSILGSWPGLPTVPDSVPENFWFSGISAWEAICGILDHLGLTVAVDLTASAPYSIVRPGNADAAFSALQTKYTTHLEDDLEWLDVGSGRAPKTIDVYFRRRNEIYGTEETVRYDAGLQWSTNAIHTETITAPALFANAVGKHYLWSDFTIKYDHDGNPLAEDLTKAAIIAQREADDYFAKIYWQTLGFMTQTYAGALPFKTGSMVDGVKWYQDHREEKYAGWRTQIVRGTNPPWPELEY